jgi:hypothetical protein
MGKQEKVIQAKAVVGSACRCVCVCVCARYKRRSHTSPQKLCRTKVVEHTQHKRR